MGKGRSCREISGLERLSSPTSGWRVRAPCAYRRATRWVATNSGRNGCPGLAESLHLSMIRGDDDSRAVGSVSEEDQ